MISGKRGEHHIRVKAKEFPVLDTITRWAIIGTSNEFDCESVSKRLYNVCKKHEEYPQRNKRKNKSFVGEEFPAGKEFPAVMIRRSALRLPGMVWRGCPRRIMILSTGLSLCAQAHGD